MTEWDVNTALNHHAGCSVYDDGACTCGLRARTEKLERSPLAPGEGTTGTRPSQSSELLRPSCENSFVLAKRALPAAGQ